MSRLLPEPAETQFSFTHAHNSWNGHVPCHRRIKAEGSRSLVFLEVLKMRTTVLIFVSVLALAAAITIEPLCNPDDCPPTYCSDPQPAVEGECCQTCKNSSCVWKGCVHFGAFGPQWYPDPCTLCGCYNGEKVCSEILCDEPKCFGFPLKTDPDACCPRCDWGIAADECAPIPVANVSLYTTLGDDVQCHDEVTRHECDKSLLQKDGRIFECRPKRRGKPVLMSHCRDVRKVIYEDVTSCYLRKPRTPILDFNPTPTLCSIRV